MTTVTVSPRFQVVIPREIREAVEVQPGHEFEAILREERIELLPIRIPKNARGFLGGIHPAVPRDDDRT